jgi:serine/threonine protein kinase
MTDRVGQQLGNYRLVKLLGKGGFAEVYLGQHVHLASKQAAIKILYLFDVDARKFQEEAETTEKLVHPHIVRLLDFDIEEGTPFLVLDYAPGGSLRNRHPKGSIVPFATVGEYLKEIAPALQYAHDQHILHRDIKPDNLLIGRRGELLLSDFGIAVLSQTGRTRLEASYGIGGTPYYMAPEAYRGKPEKASDQYALAVVVYEWLCGSVPFSVGNFIQLGYQHTHEPLPPLREKNPAIPSDVEAVILTALAKDPHQRFGSVPAFANALEQACSLPSQKAPALVEPVPNQSTQAGKSTIQIAPQEEVVSQQPEPSVPPPEPVSEQIASVEPMELPMQTPPVIQPPRQRDAVSFPTAPAAPSTRGKVPPEVEEETTLSEAQQLQHIATPPAASQLAPTVSVPPSLPPTQLVPNPPSPLPPQVTLVSQPIGTTLYTYRGHSGPVGPLTWSPQGKRIASANGPQDSTVQVWDAADGGHVFITRRNIWVVSVVWSPDGRRIALLTIDKYLEVWDAAGGGNVFANPHYRTGWAWSPDGKRIASGGWDHTVE